jgi:hypothetical protein
MTQPRSPARAARPARRARAGRWGKGGHAEAINRHAASLQPSACYDIDSYAIQIVIIMIVMRRCLQRGPLAA